MLLTIGAFARRAWLSPKALRLYERQGLLVPARVEAHNGYRWYDESQLDAARLIARLRRLDMPLALIAEILTVPAEQAAALIEVYWQGEEQRLAVRRELAGHLRLRLLDGKGTGEMFQIQLRDVPAQTVLTEQRHITAGPLPAWIGEACDRLVKAACGRHAGPLFVVYHGEVNEDSDGPVEVCLPVEGGQDYGVPARIEEAHREAYTRIVKAQVGYPQILSAFDAVAQWVHSEQFETIGAPREVYFADFRAIGPDDDACDIAQPVL